MKALQFERKDYQAKFLKQLLELIDAVDFSGKPRDFLPGNSIPAPQLTKVQPSNQNQLALIKFANSVLAHVDHAWALSVNKTAQTINLGIIRPTKWGRTQVRTLGTKVYEKTTLGVGIKLSNRLELGKNLVKNASFALFKKGQDFIEFGIVQPLIWGRSISQGALTFMSSRLSYVFERSGGLRKNKTH
jgi:hypothetical protein